GALPAHRARGGSRRGTQVSRIFASVNLAEVHHAKNLLESVGIRTVLKNEMLASAIGQLPFTECQPELWLVDPAEAERARRLLAKADIGSRLYRAVGFGERHAKPHAKGAGAGGKHDAQIGIRPCRSLCAPAVDRVLEVANNRKPDCSQAYGGPLHRIVDSAG